MRKTVPYLTAWFVAGVGAVWLASAGVAMVGQQVTDDSRPAPLSADQVRDELAAEDGITTTTTAPSATSTTGAGPTTTAGGTATTQGSGGPPASGGVATTATTSAPPPPAPAPTTKTYNLVGGTATLRFSSTGVTVVAAFPNAGFAVEVSDHEGAARVEFESDDHRSRLDGWWAGGPQDEVREDG
jgi:hypothetical protein